MAHYRIGPQMRPPLGQRRGAVAGIAALMLALAGCDAGIGPFKRASGGDDPAAERTADGGAVPQSTSVKLVDRDVEAPEVFQVTDQALWDGRPSLGGVWVASPDAVDPERVILRNTGNGKFVIGALFRRERDNPGPPLQISSDAAAALGLLAGQPASVQVTALRRDEVAPTPPDVTAPILDANEAVETTPLDTAAVASAAIDKADGGAAPAPQPAAATVSQPALQTAPSPSTPAPAAGTAVIQVGIFSVEANAERAVDTLRKAGVTAEQRRDETQGKAYWSVIARGDEGTLTAVKTAGFADAYLLKR